MGGQGSGNFGHEGRPGERGGSGGGGGSFHEMNQNIKEKRFFELHPGEHYSREEVRTVQEKYGKQPVGKGGPIEVSDVHDLDVILNDGRYGLISAGANTKDTVAGRLDADKPPEFFMGRHNDLKGSLIENGYQFTEVLGKYGSKEDSFLVMAHDANKGDLLSLGAKYNQDSVIFADKGEAEMIFTTSGDGKSYYEKDDGTRVPTAAGDAHVAKDFTNVPGGEDADYYTQVPIDDQGYARFNLGFDFSKTTPTQLPRGRKDYAVSKPIDNRQVATG